MRLFAHNILQCHVKGCNNYPLTLKVKESKTQETDFNPEFIKSLLFKIDYEVLADTAKSLGLEVPEKVNEFTPEQLQQLHSLLLEHHVSSGEMLCSKCNHSYPIENGIPNMLLNDNQV